MKRSELSLQRLSPAIGAIVQGVTLSPRLDHDTVMQIDAALADHLVLFFENQHLTAMQQRDLAARFGSLYVHPFYPGTDDTPEVMVLEHDASRCAHSDQWHSDVSYLENPPRVAILFAEEIPLVGGDTLWANMYAAYDALSSPIKALLRQLRASHSFAKNFTPERFRVLNMEGQLKRLYAEHPPVSHPVVRTNPATGRKALFVNRDFTTHIEGVSPRESETLLRFLYEHIGQPELHIRWRWQANTTVFWDNRWTQHCAMADYYPQRRLVRRATILGERPV